MNHDISLDSIVAIGNQLGVFSAEFFGGMKRQEKGSPSSGFSGAAEAAGAAGEGEWEEGSFAGREGAAEEDQSGTGDERPEA